MNDRETGIARRTFLARGSRAAAGVLLGTLASPRALRAAGEGGLRFGLVTYQWGRDWDVPTLLRNCQRAGVAGVELRVEHAHRVEPDLPPRARQEVRLRFENSPVELVGLGTNWAFHDPEPARVRAEIEGAKEYVRLSRDVGGSGVKVKPNALPGGVPAERTIEQIGRSLRELGAYGAELGQEIRLEVHGRETQLLPIIARIMEAADHPNVGVCWNSNPTDLAGEGLAHNFRLVRHRFGRTVHVHELDDEAYPYRDLFDMLTRTGYAGWILLEASSEPRDRVEALARQRTLFDRMLDRSPAVAR